MKQIWQIMEKMQGQIAGQIREMLGEPALDQKLFDEAQRNRRIEAMQTTAVADGALTEALEHEQWCDNLRSKGWTWGAEFNPAQKEHPNLCEWDSLDAKEKGKVRIFRICANAAAELDALALSKLMG